MQYTSTRGGGLRVSSAEAILTGLAPDGGLFVPAEIPQIDVEALANKPYDEAAYAVLRAFLPDYDADFLRGAAKEAYGEAFGGKAGRLQKLDDGLYALELWHGPTCAFKDYALQLMPKLLMQARRMLGEDGRTLILVATSGDTGSAALAGYGGLPKVSALVFYPENGTSLLQQLQMTTREEAGIGVYRVRGNFDDCQRGVKRAFASTDLAKSLAAHGIKLSSANSINWGRLVPQIVYYITSYLALCGAGRLRYGEALDFCVPTGNFGDIMAGWYAKRAGLPVGRLLCASNRNNVLADFLNTGRYDANRSFYKTSSPSMDILVSSNLERLLFHAAAEASAGAAVGAAAARGWMENLTASGGYTVPEAVLCAIRDVFDAGWADEAQVFSEIRNLWEKYAYLCDPHTAVAFKAAQNRQRGAAPVVVVSTASPYKFSKEVLAALGAPVPADEFVALRALQAFSGQRAPESLEKLSGKAERFTEAIDAEAIEKIPLRLV